MKTKSLLFAGFIFILFVSCDSTSIDGSESIAASLSASAKSVNAKPVEKDVSISIVGIDNSAGTGSNFVGTMTHLGEVHGATSTTLFQDNGDGTFNYGSSDILYAANGDELYTETKIVLTFNSATAATYVGGFIVTGGTGRFRGATGSFSIANGVYIINEATGIGTATHNAVGTITY